MQLTRLFYFLRGYLVITVSGQYPERFLNVCAGRRIFIWNVFSHSDRLLRCCISIRGFRLLPPIVKKTGVQIKIIEKRGFPIWIKRARKRKWFAAGLLLCVLCTICINQFVWKIEIQGCNSVSAAYIKENLAECGLKVGSFRPFLDEKRIQTKMLLAVPELSWLWVDKHGSKVNVEIKERVLPPDMVDPNDFCHLIASKDGVIDSMVITSGDPAVAPGDTVRKGDLLVSGLLLSEKDVEPRQVPSEGTVYARVWYEQTKAYSLWVPNTSETGQRVKKTTLRLFGLNIPLYRNAMPNFNEYSTLTKDHELNLFGFQPGIGLSTVTYTELHTAYEKSTVESVVQSSGRELLSAIDEMASPDSSCTESRTDYVIVDEDTIEVTVIAEYLENIAEKVRVAKE